MNKLINTSDKVAILLSFLCLMHCIALPLILVVLPTISVLLVLSDEQVHLWLVFTVIPISIFAIALGYKRHKRLMVFVSGALGLVLLVAAATFAHDVLGEAGEVALTVLGSILLAYSHFSNYKLRKPSPVAIQNSCESGIGA
ncbi:MerC domain-containing protein [Glaciecola sp. MH2013]|uniref:MerC domain-containing protein n=1 Tax=Glaciecola sp. MH2013 TaxID=2785524 RepID=UPI00189DCD08|nr:MerC domain-containing protein [Glaciecola sp. MH2013]MBF7073220.1 MerC domain-containing protein [Glaciecola sp. MH2013]